MSFVSRTRPTAASDVAYANAAIEWTKDIRHTSLSEWQRVIDINLTGVFLLTSRGHDPYVRRVTRVASW